MIKTPFANDGDSRWSPVAYLVCLVVVAGIVDLAALGPGATTANVGAHDYRDQFGNLAQALIRDVYVDVVEARGRRPSPPESIVMMPRQGQLGHTGGPMQAGMGSKNVIR